ncbi:putative phage protein (TIGR02216 family) [Aminobacter sp. AP02]|nr:putative phage protein (TIGR02216 family) [Aminobacter sp. AP02]
MAAGFGLLRLSPRDFWAMTPREFEKAVSYFGSAKGEAPGKAQLAELMKLFPDQAEIQFG